MSEGMSAERTSSWYDDAPITDEQLDTIRRSLDHPNSRVGSPFAPFVVRKLLAEVEGLRVLLAAETTTCKRWLQRVVKQGTRADNAEARCEDLRDQLARTTALAEKLRRARAELHLERDQLRAKLATRGDLISGLDAEVDRLRAHLVAEHLAAEAAETENDSLRARLDEIGETREEWAVRWLTAGGRYAYEPCDDEQEAREGDPGDGLHEVVKRTVGEWREVPDA